jgi:hypothetical protein
MSQAEASPMPPPSAAPGTRAMVGLHLGQGAQHAGELARVGEVLLDAGLAGARIQLRSAPAEKLLPRPASTTTRTASSASSRRRRR